MSTSKYPLPDNLPEDTWCFQLEVPADKEYVQLLVGALSWLSFWDAYDRDPLKRGREVAALWRNALDSLQACGDTPTPPPIVIKEIVKEYVGGIIEIESEDDMSNRLYIHKVNGVPYFAHDCGCGEIEYYKAQSVQVNPETGAIGEPYDQIPNDTLPVDPGAAESCYWTAAANVIISKITGYINSLAGYYQTGAISVFLGAGIETQQMVAAILNGNAQINFSNLGITPAEVTSALTASGYRAWLVEKLEERGLSGQLTRWNVARLTQSIFIPSIFNLPTPIAPYTEYWGLFVNLQDLNDALSTAATQCRTGINPVQGNGWEIDLTQYGSESELPFIINDNGSGQLGTLDPFVGLRPSNVSQWQLWVSWEMPAGIDILEVGYRVAEGGMGGNPFLRSICNYDDVGCSGTAVNISGFAEQNISSPSTTTDGAGIYFNALTGDEIAFDRLRILFDGDVSMPLGWTPYEFV